MEAGHELDTLIAIHVFGDKVVKSTYGKEKQYVDYTIGKPHWIDLSGEMQLTNPVPNYSGDIKEAWEVVDKLINVEQGAKGNGYNPEFSLEIMERDIDMQYYSCVIYDRYGRRDWENKRGSAYALTAPHAICLAALKVLNVKLP